MLADTELELSEEEDALCDVEELPDVLSKAVVDRLILLLAEEAEALCELDADTDKDPLPLAVDEVEKTRELEELDRTGHGYPANHSGLITETAPASKVPRGWICLAVNVLK